MTARQKMAKVMFDMHGSNVQTLSYGWGWLSAALRWNIDHGHDGVVPEELMPLLIGHLKVNCKDLDRMGRENVNDSWEAENKSQGLT